MTLDPKNPANLATFKAVARGDDSHTPASSAGSEHTDEPFTPEVCKAFAELAYRVALDSCGVGLERAVAIGDEWFEIVSSAFRRAGTDRGSAAESLLREIRKPLTAALSEAQAERDKARDEAMDWYGCIAMAQETLDALIYLRRAEKGKAAMFLPEAIRNACVLVRDEALAYAEDGYQAALTAKDAELARLKEVQFTEEDASRVQGAANFARDMSGGLANKHAVSALRDIADRIRRAARASTETPRGEEWTATPPSAPGDQTP